MPHAQFPLYYLLLPYWNQSCAGPLMMLDHARMQQELMGIVGRKVDLVSKRAIEWSHNWTRRQEILETARVIYAQE
ncbi:MAG: hypothetical protein F6J93_04560 [Oscillatoria sp. SIO1A7]|nr:hypothetical protein [Oscillatoria sp. SIO1A7]